MKGLDAPHRFAGLADAEIAAQIGRYRVKAAGRDDADAFGGGFVMVPAMIYLLGMPTSVVVGTSLFQIVFVTANVTLLQAINNQTVDIVLALLLLVGGVIGAQLGAMFGTRLRGEQLRVLLGLIVLAVCGGVAYNLVAAPTDPFSLAGIGSAR